MKSTAAAALTIIAFGVGAASAADMPVPRRAPEYTAAPVRAFDWSGVYIGGHAGYAWGADGGTDFRDDPSGSFEEAFEVGQIVRSVSSRPRGFVGGGQIGINWQPSQNALVGVEASFSGTDIHGSGAYIYPGDIAFPSSQTVEQSLTWLATVRGRVGLVAGRLMAFGTGGLAFGQVKNSFLLQPTVPDIPLVVRGSESKVKVGWTAGAGAEYAIDANWSLVAQWLYYDLGKTTASGPQVTEGVPQPFALHGTAQTKGNIIWAGLNYRL